MSAAKGKGAVAEAPAGEVAVERTPEEMLAEFVREYDREQFASDVMAGDLTEDRLMALTAVASEDYKAAKDVERRAVVNVAYATGRAYVLGVLGRKRSAADFVSQDAWAKVFGVLGTNVTGWRTLGYALVNLGWDRNGAAYALLSTNGRFEKGEVRKFITALPVPTDDIARNAQEADAIAWLSERYDALGKVITPESGTPRVGDGTEPPADDAPTGGDDAQSDTGGTGTDTGVTGIKSSDAGKAVAAAVAVIERNAPAMFDGEEWSELRDRLMAVIEAQDARHAERERLLAAKRAEAGEEEATGTE